MQKEMTTAEWAAFYGDLAEVLSRYGVFFQTTFKSREVLFVGPGTHDAIQFGLNADMARDLSAKLYEQAAKPSQA